ncbi:histidine kinase [Streptomyces sp. NBC_01775]|uniref:sensor histidine kinase n=1 Tax=Streptomyces sp. NBC_01775 TaxID=2975939 RepID=UPI002DD8DFBF|nr:histidine kinase [Streptomyces sp. NBC_01775]WSB79869.1 histidine kinase [Streptomyces sp. NBC_01775]
MGKAKQARNGPLWSRRAYDAVLGSRQRDLDGPDTRSASRIALILLVVTLCGFLSSATLHLLTIGGSLLQVLGGAAALIGLFVTQIMRSAPRVTPLRRRQVHTLLWVQAVLVYAPVALMGASWVSLPGLLAGSVLLSLRRPWSWVLTLAVWGSVFWLTSLYGFSGMEGVYIGVSSMTTTAMVVGLTLLSQMVMRLRAAQQEIARLAVEQERLRFARDLHDLLGYSLSAITLRSELAHRLVDGDPVRAKNEVTSVLEVSRQALADVRAVARSYRNISLPAEVSSAVSVFEAAGIEAEVDTSLNRIPEAVGTVLATVLREGVTNILRHSKVRKCVITVSGDAGCAVLRLVNDGVQPRPDPADPTTPAPDTEGGSGIGNLSARVGAIGGTLSAREADDGCFHLEARVPLTPSSRPGDPGAHARLSSAV